MEIQDNPEPGKIEWPLFERMRLAAQRDSCGPRERQNLILTRPAADTPKSVIPLKDFNSTHLFAELAKLSGSGGELYLPAGRIELNKELKLHPGVRIIGVLGATELVFKDTLFGLTIMGGETFAAGVRVENLRIRHEGPHKFCAAVFVTRATDLFFSDVEIIAPRAIGFLFSDDVHRVRLDRCAVYNAGLVGFMMVRNVRDTVLQSCIAEGCEQSGVFLTDLKLPQGMDPLDFDAQIQYTNEVIGHFGPFAPEDPSPYRNALISGSFCGNRKMGVTTDGVGYLRVVGCNISDNDCEGIAIDNGSWGYQIQNCHIRGNGWRGRQHAVELGHDFVKEMGLMDDGSSKAKLPGVSLDNAVYSRIENNCIEGNWGDGVKFVRAVHSCTVAGNIIADNNRGINDRFHFFGVLAGVAKRQHSGQSDFPSCNNRIIENDILGPHFAGVHLMPGTTGNLVRGNRIIGPTFTAIENHTSGSNIVYSNGPELDND